MSNFQESGINFKFQSPKWNVVKYDEHLAHKKVSNALQPTKAVDFLGIHDNRQLFLVEVKNYRGHTHDAETQEVLQAKGEELMRRIAVKVRDTIATVTNSARFSTNDEDFFTRINQLLLDNQKKIVIIACIELDIAGEKEHKARMSVWMQKLKQKLAWLHAAKISINPNVFYGDVNLDGDVDLADAVLLNKAVAGSVTLNQQAALNADCNNDGKRSADDSMVLLKFLVHLVNDLPAAN